MPQYLLASDIPKNKPEEVGSINPEKLTNADISSLVKKITLSNGQNPDFTALINASKNAEVEFIKDGYFVLALFASGIANKPEIGIAALSKQQVYKEKSYGLNDVNDPSKLLEKTYSWLVINTSFIVPSVLAENHPALIYRKTPFWGSSLDGKFRIEIPEHWDAFFKDPDLQKWQTLLDDIETPSKEVLHGTMRNSKFKREQLANGLITNNTDYFYNNFQQIKPEKWIEYWSLQGAYQYRTYQDYLIVKNISINKMANFLTVTENISQDKSNQMANNYINFIENNYVHHDRYVREYSALIETLNNSGWKTIVKDQELLDEWDHGGKLKAIGGYLLFNNTDNLIPYLEWLYAAEYYEIVSELIGLSVVIDGNHFQLINLMKNTPSQWGKFNKTPMMYAAQYDKYEVLEFLFNNYIDMTSAETLAGEKYDYEMPKIGTRTVLTYALEHASYKTIKLVIDNTSPSMHKKKDTAGRDVLEYLSMNTGINEDERSHIIDLLKSKINQGRSRF